MQKNKKTLQSYLNTKSYSGELFSRSSVNTIIRALLEPVLNKNTQSILFSRFKNKEGILSMIKRLEYCSNVEMIDVSLPEILTRDNFVELEFIIFNSARYSFALIWDYSNDKNKNYTKLFFLANSRSVNDVFEALQNSLSKDYREKFYLYKPERRDNELLNTALSNILRNLNNNIEENNFTQNETLIVDLTKEENIEEKLGELSHDIKNQISIIDTYSQILQKKIGREPSIDAIKKACFNLLQCALRLKDLDFGDVKELNVTDLINELILTYAPVLNENNNTVELNSKIEPQLMIFGDKNRLMSVFYNILQNANECVKNDNFVIELECKNNFLNIDFINHGSAVLEKEKIFNKGYTTKATGFGLGLFGAKKYIETELKGSLKLLSSDSEKTVFRVSLPLLVV